MVFGSVIPSIYYNFFPKRAKYFQHADPFRIGLYVLAGLAVCILGTVLCGKAGTWKEK